MQTHAEGLTVLPVLFPGNDRKPAAALSLRKGSFAGKIVHQLPGKLKVPFFRLLFTPLLRCLVVFLDPPDQDRSKRGDHHDLHDHQERAGRQKFQHVCILPLSYLDRKLRIPDPESIPGHQFHRRLDPFPIDPGPVRRAHILQIDPSPVACDPAVCP